MFLHNHNQVVISVTMAHALDAMSKDVLVQEMGEEEGLLGAFVERQRRRRERYEMS